MPLPTPQRRALEINESAEHARAKHRLARWLTAPTAGSREPPTFRVMLEYPFTEGGGGVIAISRWAVT